MPLLFLDTSFLVALEDADDQNHFHAISYWKKFKKQPAMLVTTDYVFDETVTFMKHTCRQVGTKENENVIPACRESFLTIPNKFMKIFPLI